MEIKFNKIDQKESEVLADWLSSDTWPFFIFSIQSKESVQKRIEAGEFFGEGELNFWILNSTNEKIGLIELYQLDDLTPMFSIRFKTQFRGKGFGKPTLDFITKYVFEKFPDKRRIEGQTTPVNWEKDSFFSDRCF